MSHDFSLLARDVRVADRSCSRVRQSRSLRALVALLATLACSTWARADDGDNVRMGKELAAKLCSRCHAMPSEPGGVRPLGISGRSFEKIAKGNKAAPGALRDFLRTAHNSVSHPGNMPNPELTDQQIQLISDYIASLRTPK